MTFILCLWFHFYDHLNVISLLLGPPIFYHSHLPLLDVMQQIRFAMYREVFFSKEYIKIAYVDRMKEVVLRHFYMKW